MISFLDQEIKDQLRELFSKLEKETSFMVMKSNHPKQLDLLSFLKEIKNLSSKIKIIELEESSLIPRFYLGIEDQKTNVSFSGIPLGHEFNSLILAILNINNIGKFPDKSILERIRSISPNNKILFKTFISLTCENCPEVVQSLNLISILNPNISHEMIDGEFVQEEIEKLGVLGLPSVVHDNQLLLSGKNSLISILEKLEQSFEKKETNISNLGKFDVAIIGGGPAGISSAIYSSRKGLNVVLITDKIGGQTLETKGIENLISVPYIEGNQLSKKLEEHLSNYSLKLFESRKVVDIIDLMDHKVVKLSSGEFLEAKSIIMATGAKWRNLNVLGEKEFLGKGVAYCPHCDGPLFKGKDVIVVGGGNSGVEAVLDLSKIVKSITLLELGPSLKADKVLVDKLNSLSNIEILLNASIQEIKGDSVVREVEIKINDQLISKKIDGIFVQIGLVPNSDFIRSLVEINKKGEIIVDDKGRTNIKGIYAAGDVSSSSYKQIVIAIGSGATASLSCFEDLI